jgi:hypothetical protein
VPYFVWPAASNTCDLFTGLHLFVTAPTFFRSASIILPFGQMYGMHQPVALLSVSVRCGIMAHAALSVKLTGS